MEKLLKTFENEVEKISEKFKQSRANKALKKKNEGVFCNNSKNSEQLKVLKKTEVWLDAS